MKITRVAWTAIVVTIAAAWPDGWAGAAEPEPNPPSATAAPAAATATTTTTTAPATAATPTVGSTPTATATASARSQLDAERESRTRYAQGEAAFKAGRYTQAIAEFEAGFAAVPKPGFLLNVGHAHRRLGDLHKARAAYKKFLLVDPTSNLHDDVLAVIREIDSALADDDRADRLAALATAAALTPPPLPSPGASRPAGIDLSARARSPTGSDADHAARPFYRRTWFWVAVGAAAVGAGVGVYALQGTSSDSVHSSGSLGVLRP